MSQHSSVNVFIPDNSCQASRILMATWTVRELLRKALSTKSFNRQHSLSCLKFIKKDKISAAENPKPIKDYCYPVTTAKLIRNRGFSCAAGKKFVLTFLFVLFPLVQIIIQNLTTYSVYTVNVQAASLSAINPRRILLGLHSTSRKVNAPLFAFAPFFVSSPLARAFISGGINFNFLSAAAV